LYQDFCHGNGSLSQPIDKKASECQPLGDEIITYLNRDDVQQAIGVRKAAFYPGGKRVWEVCDAETSKLKYEMDRAPGDGLMPYLRDIFKFKPDLKLLYYSGDVDIATVSTQSTQACLHELLNSSDVKITKPWKPWKINGWHVGYVEEFDRYTFATIKGAGHEAPTYQPAVSFEMVKRFIQQGNLDDKKNPWGNTNIAEIKQHKKKVVTQSQRLKSIVAKMQAEKTILEQPQDSSCENILKIYKEKRQQWSEKLLKCVNPSCTDSHCVEETICSNMGMVWKRLNQEWNELILKCPTEGKEQKQGEIEEQIMVE